MKKLIIPFLFILLPCLASAQFVNIPDSNFRKFLDVQFPGAITGTDLDTTFPTIVNANTLLLDSLFLYDLTGLQYFDNLTYLDCSANMLHSLPSLPVQLGYLKCAQNFLDSLPTIPSGVTQLICYGNQLDTLPVLPSGLTALNCSMNQLDTLIALPSGLLSLDIGSNLFHALPQIPSTLTSLNCHTNFIDTLIGLPAGLTQLDCSNNPLNNLPVLPPSLIDLTCRDDSLSTLPSLPTALNSLNCSSNQLSNLTPLPTSLSYLDCSTNLIDSLPILPGNLVYLNCMKNQLDSLPMLPIGLSSLFCATNNLSVLPTLPSNLNSLDCSYNPLSVLPNLPPNLINLYWNGIFNWTILPSLPATLTFLETNYNQLDSLPTLPNGLKTLMCIQDSLLQLPSLPTGLKILDCSQNMLTVLPPLPSVLTSLSFHNNQISSIASLPTLLRYLNCSYNSSLNCLPKLPATMDAISINSTGILCIPNTVTFSDTTSTSYFVSLPLCTPSSGCPVAWNIAGDVHQINGSNCQADSINPGNKLKNLKVFLQSSGIPIDSLRINHAGNYSFDVPLNVTYDLNIPTSGLPFDVVCPVSAIQTVTPTTLDSLKSDINFAIECNGIDVGVKSIIGRFRPGLQSEVKISAGDMAQFYNVTCNIVASAEVTIYLGGPITYVQPAVGALNPTLISGNVVKYVVPNIASVDMSKAFNIIVLTDPEAAIGNAICIKVEVSCPVDFNTNNNDMYLCFPVVNSFDPNAKEVYPEYMSKAGDELTYTIHFQNTGNDTAYRVVIRDQLSKNLDWNSFEYINSSHDVSIGRKESMVTFTFDQINLPAEKQDEPLSHGWVLFKIRTKNDLVMGSKTSNQVGIYFDSNPAITTNIANSYLGFDTSKFVHVNPIQLPGGITPNQDGLNDRWHVLNQDYLDLKKIVIQRIMIRNRWGKTVYQATGNMFEWLPQQDEPMDAYNYVIYYTVNGIDHDMQYGTVEIIR